jgi:Ser/Thr protein kinase RdoA (MazF antagonist)
LLCALPAFWKWRRALQGQTLIHGDAHFWNFLYPLDPQEHRTYLLDWQTYRISSGTDDLAYTIVLRYPHRTPANERDLVKCYHEELLRHGVTDYSWEQCWHDYRRSAAEQLLVTLDWAGWASNGRYVQRALTGFRDLACDEFLDSAL